MRILQSLVSVFYVISASSALNILVSYMHVSASHKKSLVPTVLELARRGHNVTMWNPFVTSMPVKFPPDLAIHQIDTLVLPTDRVYLDTFVHGNMAEEQRAFLMRPYPDKASVILEEPWEWASKFCELAILQKRFEVDKMLNMNWDLVILDEFFAPCGQMVALVRKLPYVVHGVSFAFDTALLARGISPAKGSYPGALVHYEYDTGSLYWRLWTLWETIRQRIGRAKIDSLVRDATSIYAEEMQRYSNLGFVADAVAYVNPMGPVVDWPKPQVYGSVFANPSCSGFSDADVDRETVEFIEHEGSRGTIVVGFGHTVSFNTLPAFITEAFLAAFKRLKKYRVIWQYDGHELQKLPSHIKTMEWIPQQALLRHEKTLVFITHGGYKSTVEALCAGVPLIVVPFFAEQAVSANMIANRLKVGKALDKTTLDEIDLHHSLLAVITQPVIKRNAVKVSGMLHDQLVEPIQQMAFWIEFAHRHSTEMVYFRPKSVTLNYFVLFSLDVAVTWFFFVGFMMYWLTRCLRVLKG